MDATGQPLRPAAAANVVDMANEARAFLAAHPEITIADLFVIDQHGIARGKRLPAASLHKVFGSGLAMPRSALAVDV